MVRRFPPGFCCTAWPSGVRLLLCFGALWS
eukprot:COSAG06_NODE_47684_length_337_cov_1.088235_1_plen_29_part_10